MKKLLFLLPLLLLAKINRGQVYKINDYNGKTLNVCKGQFTGSNGLNTATVYGNNENYTVTFCSGDPNRNIRANFFYIGIEKDYDFLYVYDGPTATGTPKATFTGTIKFPGVVTSTGTCLTFKFVSDNINGGYGWDVFLGCTPVSCTGNQPASDECISATPICNLGGYCGSTSGWYTRGAEAANIDGTTTTATPFCGETHNNSWLSFTASTSSASFDITSSNCSDASQGIQAVIFESNDCKTFLRKSTDCFANEKGNFTLSANALTIGKKYYIMVDGAYGNDCDYTILAKSGVQTINITASNSNTLCSGQPLEVTANATGIGPFTYKWSPKPISSNADSSKVVYPVTVGMTYTCSVTGVCGTPASVTYSPSVNTTPVITVTDSAHICTGGNGTILNATLLNSSASINFTNGKTESIPDNNAAGIISNIAVGNISGNVSTDLQQVCLSINHGTVSELDISLRAPNGNIIDLSSGNGGTGSNYTKTCFSASGAPPITSGTAPFTGTYLPEQPFSDLAASTINGTWSLLIKDTKANNTGLLTGWSLAFKNDFAYSWSPTSGLSPSSGTNVTANPSGTITYTATVTDKAGCFASKPVKVNVTNTPSAPIVISPVIYCVGATALPLTANGSGLLWYTNPVGGTGSVTAPIPSTAIAGSFDYYVSQKASICEGSRAKITVIVNSKLDASFSYSSSDFCQNTSNQFPVIAPGAIAGTFKSSPAGLFFVNATTGEIDLKASIPGTYTIINEIAPIGGCEIVTSKPVTITIHPEPELSNSSTAEICSGNQLNITLMSNVASSFSWIAADNSAITGETYTSPKQSNVINDMLVNQSNVPQIVHYTVTLTSNTGGCMNLKPQIIDVTVNPAPVLNNNSTAQICSGNALNIELISSIASSFSWIAFDNTNTTGETYLSPKQTHVINDVLVNQSNVPQIVHYTVTLTSNTGGCMNLKPQIIDVTVNPEPELSNGSTAEICSGNPVNITLTSNIASSFSWIAADNTNTTGESYVSPKQTNIISDILVNQSHVAQIVHYTVTLISKNGACMNLKPQTIDVTVNRVTAAFTANPTSGEMPLFVQFTNNAVGAMNYSWDFGDGGTSTDHNPTYTYNQIGHFEVCLTADDNKHCTDKTCFTIEVDIHSAFVIPNVFTPNNDGVNDVFTIAGKGLESLHAEIYNRWGQKEYEWDTINGGWDGHSASGMPSSDGTYFFMIEITGMDGKKYSEKGSVSLMR